MNELLGGGSALTDISRCPSTRMLSRRSYIYLALKKKKGRLDLLGRMF